MKLIFVHKEDMMALNICSPVSFQNLKEGLGIPVGKQEFFISRKEAPISSSVEKCDNRLQNHSVFLNKILLLIQD